jgi:hypothetical protein
MQHTPIDFLLSSAVLGSISLSALGYLASVITRWHLFQSLAMPSINTYPASPTIAVCCALWMLNHILRAVILHHSDVYERKAAAALLNTDRLRGTFLVSFAFLGLALFLALTGHSLLAVPTALAAIISSRYLFFVSVVPLNMALTFIRQVHA